MLDLGVPDPGALEVWHTRDWCHKELGRLRELEEEDDRRVLATLDAALVPGFAAPGAPRGRRCPRTRASGRPRTPSSTGCGRGSRNAACRLPKEFEARFRSRDPKAPGWFGCFMAYVQDALKKDGKAQWSFLPRQLAKLREAQGATADLVQRLLEGQARQLDRMETAQEREARLAGERHAEVMAVLNREKGVPHATLRALLARMGEEGVAEEAVEARLTAKAEEYRTLRDELARRTNDRPDATAARDRALQLLDAGDFAGARAVLAEGRGRLRELREQTARAQFVRMLKTAGPRPIRRHRTGPPLAGRAPAGNLVRTQQKHGGRREIARARPPLSAPCRYCTRSTHIATPMPPPMHSVARPRFAPRRCISNSSVFSTRAPRRADRVADGDGAAVHVHLRRVPAEVLVHRAGLRREGLVGLDQVQRADVPTRLLAAPCARPGSARCP